MTGYVATDYYMAPEVMLTWKEYGEKIDIWSAGCIFAEMLRGQPLFPRQNEIHQLHVITELLGTPSEDIISEVTPREVGIYRVFIYAAAAAHCEISRHKLIL
jgi:serine/threonine protein kinase